MSVHDALAAASRAIAPPTKRASALVVGARGPLGERVLDQALASALYEWVHVAVTAPMRTRDRKLVAWQVTLDTCPTPPPVRDAYLLLDTPAGRRDANFRALSLSDLTATAAHLAGHGVARLIVIAPLASWLQMSAAAAATLGGAELQLPRLGFESITILRPAERTRALAKRWGERIADGLAHTLLGYMLPASLQPLMSRDVAKAALKLALAAPPGVKTFDADQLHEVLGKRHPRHKL
jgi:hypothetical protein